MSAIRAAHRGEGQSLTQRQALALAGEWYNWYVARHEENPGPIEHWRSMWDALIFHLEEHAPDWVIEDGWRDLECRHVHGKLSIMESTELLRPAALSSPNAAKAP
jgi:hypothetical protein